MNGVVKFNLGIIKSPLRVKLWVGMLLAANLAPPLLFLDHIEAQVVLLSLVGSLGLMSALTGLSGFTRLVGAGHAPWIPLLAWLWMRLDQLPAGDALGVWIRALILVNTISLLLDGIDAFRYLAGDREEVVLNLS